MFVFIEFIKQVGEKRQNARLAEHIIVSLATSLIKLINNGARMLDSIYHIKSIVKI